MSTGPHPMTYFREALSKLQVKRACDLPRVPHEQYTRVAGCVIARQRPGTAKSFVFLSLEDETGISKVIDRKSTRLNSSHEWISYAVFCLKKKSASESQSPSSGIDGAISGP